MSTTADAEGQLSLTGTSDDRTQFRATKEDHYTLTFVADSTCTDLPNELRTRTYAATITPESNSHSLAHTLFSLAREPPTRPCPRRFGATALRRGRACLSGHELERTPPVKLPFGGAELVGAQVVDTEHFLDAFQKDRLLRNWVSRRLRQGRRVILTRLLQSSGCGR